MFTVVDIMEDLYKMDIMEELFTEEVVDIMEAVIDMVILKVVI